MPDKKRQHIVPQFLQRNFAIDESKKRVRVYLVKENKFIDKTIKTNIQKSYFYGKSGETETRLGQELEAPTSLVIAQMIKNPKKFMRKHKTLDETTLRFFNTLRNRSGVVGQLVDDLNSQFMQVWEESPTFDESQEILHKEFKKTMLDTNELRGKGAMAEPNEETKKIIFNGEYLLVKTKTPLFLSDEMSVSIFPLSSHLLLILGDMAEMMKQGIMRRSNACMVDFVNAWTLSDATNLIIVSPETSDSYIKRLNKINAQLKLYKYKRKT
ncbi:MAG: DUF4238 domain-containing protein [Lactococcus petauri]